jgi:hypothetical protein
LQRRRIISSRCLGLWKSTGKKFGKRILEFEQHKGSAAEGMKRC